MKREVTKSLRLLLVEDSEDDALLLLRELRRGGYDPIFTRVEIAETLQRALTEQQWDIIIADYRLPQFSAPEALELAQASGLDLPFIVVSGAIGEETAVAMMKAGAHDYVMKDNLTRLIPAIERELHEAVVRHERRRAEEQIRYQANLLENVSEAIISTDAQFKIQSWNNAAEIIYGWHAAEIIGKQIDKVISTIYFDSDQELAIDQLFRVGFWQGEVVQTRKDGANINILASVSLIKDSQGNPVGAVTVNRDITQRRQLYDQLLQSQKMEALGRLAGGVAHDFNNLLTVIGGYAELLLARHPADNDPVRQEIQQIEKAGERATTLTRQLLTFSRRQVFQPEIFDLNVIVIEMEKMLRRLIGENIALIIRTDPALGLVKADSGQMEQVIMNLVVNACDAMPEGGKLIIETSKIEVDEIYALQHVDMEPGRYVMLAVSDSGHGIEASVQSHIFEPFFTTKEEEKGTGLGLATVHGIITQSDGHIWVYSEVNQGTTFKLYLPHVELSAEPVSQKKLSPEILTGSETILLVEDEAMVRDLARDILRLAGYTVLEAEDGDQAVELWAEPSCPIDLLLTDVVMPGSTSGSQLAKRLGMLYSGMKVLYMSGYTRDAVAKYGILETNVALLQKPFTRKDLLRKVRETLDNFG